MVHSRHKKKVSKKSGGSLNHDKNDDVVNRRKRDESATTSTEPSISHDDVSTQTESITLSSSSSASTQSETRDDTSKKNVRKTPNVVRINTAIKDKKPEQVFTISSKPGRIVANNDIYKELISKQLKNVPDEWRLGASDMKRICKYIDTSIFDENQCCFWKGYITNANSSNKGTYVNFYFKHKKVALHRLLYSNFVAPLSSNEYLKFNCENKGICCNVCHYRKYKYSKNMQVPRKNPPKEVKKVPVNVVTIGGDSDDLILDFD